MADDQLPAQPKDNEPEVRLELTNQGVRQVWALYSQDRPEPEFRDPDPTYSIFLRELPGLLWRGRWALSASLVGALALGAFYVLNTTPVYNVGASLLIEKRDVPLSEGQRFYTGVNFLATQAEILQSPTIVRRAVESLPEDVLAKARAQGPEYDPIREMIRVFEAQRLVGADVVVLTMRTEDRQLGVQLTNAILDSYRQYLRGFEISGQQEAHELLQRNEKELRDELTALNTQYHQLRASGGSLGEGDEALSVQRSVLERHAQMMVEAKIQRIELENQLEAARLGGTRETQSPDTVRLRDQLSQAQVREAELSLRYSPEHPELRTAREQITALRGQLEASLRDAPAGLLRQVQAARDTERRLTALYQSEFEHGKQLDAHRLQEQDLRGEIVRVETLHADALRRLKDQEVKLEAISQGEGAVMVKLLDGPGASEEPIWPQPLLVFLCALLVGGAVGISIVLMNERNARQREAAEVARAVPRPPRAVYRPTSGVDPSESAPLRPSVVDMARER